MKRRRMAVCSAALAATLAAAAVGLAPAAEAHPSHVTHHTYLGTFQCQDFYAVFEHNLAHGDRFFFTVHIGESWATVRYIEHEDIPGVGWTTIWDSKHTATAWDYYEKESPVAQRAGRFTIAVKSYEKHCTVHVWLYTP